MAQIEENFDHTGMVWYVNRGNYRLARIATRDTAETPHRYVLDMNYEKFMTEEELTLALKVISALNRGEYQDDWT